MKRIDRRIAQDDVAVLRAADHVTAFGGIRKGEAARQQLVEMREQKGQLEIMAADYEAQLKTLALEKTRSRIKLDDSRLAEIKASMDKLRERIETARKTALLAEEFNGGKPVETNKVESNKEIVDQAKEYLAPKEKAEAVKN